MNYKSRTEILLAILIATGEMLRHTVMFPEVFCLDVTANTYKQKLDLFLMVVKDSNVNVCVGNTAIIPSDKRWVCMA